MTYPVGFYVYQLIDPRSDRPFYVGKGQHSRAWQHEKAVRLGRSVSNRRKTDLIHDILSCGMSVTVKIVEIFDSAADALDLEYRIAEADPTLTNIQEGGCGHELTPEQYAARHRARMAKLARLRKIEKARKNRVRDLSRISKMDQFRDTSIRLAGNANARAEVERWFDAMGSKELKLNTMLRTQRQRKRSRVPVIR